MPTLATNPDVPLSWRVPGVRVYINANSPGSGSSDISHRLLILGERNASGAALAANAIYAALSEQDVIDNSGRGSAVHLQYIAAMAHAGAGAVEAYVGHVDQAGAGVAAIYPVILSGTATGPGQFDMWVAGRKASVGFVKDDTAATIAAAMEVELDKITDSPITWGVASATLTGTHRHKAAHGEDVPMMFYVTPSKGIKVGPGDAVFATNVTDAGTVRITNGTTTISAAISNAWTPAQVASALDTAINASDSVFTSSVNTATLSVFYANNKVIRRTSAKIITSTGTTINWNGSGAIAAGTEAPAGTLGTGSATLTTLLTNLTSLRGFGRWSCPWTDVTTLGTLATHIEDQGSGLKQKNQVLHVCSTAALATAGAIPTGTTPALTSSMRYAVHHIPDGAQMGYEYAARTAAARAANERPSRNWDGYALKTNANVPLLGQPIGQRATEADMSSAINTYFLSPIHFDESSGKVRILFGRTTSNSSDREMHDWSCIDQLDKQRAEIVDKMSARFFSDEGGTSYMRAGIPFSSGIITVDSIEDEMYELALDWEKRGFYDGADALKEGINASANDSDAGRIDLVYTASVVVPIHQINVVANRGSAPAAAA